MYLHTALAVYRLCKEVCDYRVAQTDLPPTRKHALKLLRKFIKQLREYRKARGLTLKYIYVTEGLHSDKRFHHHLIINAAAGDYEVIRSLWVWGEQVDFEPLAEREYSQMAHYLTKESVEGKPNGAQLWTGSRNLTKPTVETSWTDANETLTVPAGCVVIEREERQNEFGSFSYIAATAAQDAPAPYQQAFTRPAYTV